jgi:hypothetical protein
VVATICQFVLSDGDQFQVSVRHPTFLSLDMLMDTFATGTQHREDASIRKNAKIMKKTSFTLSTTTMMAPCWQQVGRINMLDSTMNKPSRSCSK